MKIKSSLLALALLVSTAGLLVTSMDAEAKRLGGGRPAGMQRQMPAKQPTATPNQTPGAPTNAAQPGVPAQAPAPVAAPGKRSWLGPIAGVAAGLGIAALMSHFGMGAAMGNFLTMALFGVVAVMVVGWLMRRFQGAGQSAGPSLATAGAPYSPPVQAQPQVSAYTPVSNQGGASSVGAVGDVSQVPAGFDAAGFERFVKMMFIRLQAANDAGNVDDLRKFTTPELFASLRLDMQERGSKPNQTDVMQLDAQLVDTAQENGQWVATVRFHGLIREEADQGAQPFDELWHFVKPAVGEHDWAIAGITPQNVAQ